jgi:hypothetical protein
VEGEDAPSESAEWAQTTDPEKLKLMTMAQRVFIESGKFIAEQSQNDAVFKKEQEKIAAQMKAFETLDADLEELQSESESASRIFKNKMNEMNAARQQKIDANKRIV